MTRLSRFGVLAALLQTACASSIAAWWTGLGPSVMVQNQTTGQLAYSLCTSNNTPVFPLGDGQKNIFDTSDLPPRPGSSIAGQGYLNGQKVMVASLFYQLTNGSIVNALYTCDMASGLYTTHNGSWIISNGAPTPHAESGLSAILLGSTAGYRVYYHDQNSGVQELAYNTKAGWYYSGTLTQDPMLGKSVHAAFTTSGSNYNISVVMARDALNMEVSRYNTDKTWHLSTFPQSLAGLASNSTPNVPTNSTPPAEVLIDYNAPVNFSMPSWTGTPGGVGMAIDNTFTRWVYYVGADSRLYQIASINFIWRPVSASADPATLDALWPAAIEASADVAVASDKATSAARIYYFPSTDFGARPGQLVEARIDNGLWRTATLLATEKPKVADANTTVSGGGGTPTEVPTTGESGAVTPNAGTGLSGGAIAGIAIGAVAGAIFLAVVLLYVRWLSRKMGREKAELDALQREEAARNGGYRAYAPAPGAGGGGAAGGGGGYVDHNGAWQADSKSPFGWVRRLSQLPTGSEQGHQMGPYYGNNNNNGANHAQPYTDFGTLQWTDAPKPPQELETRAPPVELPTELSGGAVGVDHLAHYAPLEPVRSPVVASPPPPPPPPPPGYIEDDQHYQERGHWISPLSADSSSNNRHNLPGDDGRTPPNNNNNNNASATPSSHTERSFEINSGEANTALLPQQHATDARHDR